MSVEPAPPLSAAARDVLERLDPDATRTTDAGLRYVGRDGGPLPTAEVEAALREQDRHEPSLIATAVYRVEDPEALTGLLFVAPDAPLTPAAFGLLAAVRVTRLAGDASDELYEVRGLDSSGARPGPDRVVYGLVGDAFVVASSEALAREVAAMSTEPAPEAATRLRVDVARLLDRLTAQIGEDEDVRVVRALLAAAELSASAQDGDVVAEAELRWAR